MGTLAKTNRNLFPSIPSFFEDMLSKDWMNWPLTHDVPGSSMPAINVKETNDAYELEVAAPGMTKKDFKVQLDHNMLVITGEKESKEEDHDGNGSYSRREFSYQSFTRSFSLPERLVKGDKIAAKYTDGILYISIPKTEEAKVKQVKQIQIS